MGDDPNRRGGSRRWIVTAVENSLRRLDTDWIDLYQVHRPDPAVDVEETLGALTDLVTQGKFRYIGSSSYSAGEIVEFVSEVEGVTDVTPTMVFTPPWTPDKMSEDAKFALGY